MTTRTTARRAWLAAALAGGILVAAAAPALAGDSGAALRPPTGDWKRTFDGVKQTITFAADGKVYGDAGCNRFTGGYTVKGDRMEIGPLASTMMYCEGKMDAEQSLLKSLESVHSYSATTTTLKLMGGGSTLKFTKR